MNWETICEQLETLKDADLDKLLELLCVKSGPGREEKINRILEEDSTVVEEAFANMTFRRKSRQ